MSTVRPYRWTGITHRVRGVSACWTISAVSRAVLSSTSTKRGTAPLAVTASAVAMKLLLGTTTSSPGPTPAALSASSRAEVPDETPTAWSVSHQDAKACSNFSTSSPRVNAPSRAMRSTASRSSVNSSGSAWSSRTKGICSVASAGAGATELGIIGEFRLLGDRRGDGRPAQCRHRHILRLVELQEDRRSLPPRTHSQLREDRGQVALDRALREEQLASDLGIGEPVDTSDSTWRSRCESAGRSRLARTLPGTTDWPLATARTVATRVSSSSDSKTKASAPASSARRTPVPVAGGEMTTIGGLRSFWRRRRSVAISRGASTLQIRTMITLLSSSPPSGSWPAAMLTCRWGGRPCCVSVLATLPFVSGSPALRIRQRTAGASTRSNGRVMTSMPKERREAA